jgi:integrase/recombinase XerD
VTRLRKLMLEELERRNYSASTARAYLAAVEDFARYFKRSPDQLGPDHIRQYQAYLFRDRKLAPNSVTQRLAALRFFYIKTLKQSWSVELTPYPKKVLRLPSILSQEEVSLLIESAPTPFQRTLLMALYATGLRRAELARLKITTLTASAV